MKANTGDYARKTLSPAQAGHAWVTVWLQPTVDELEQQWGNPDATAKDETASALVRLEDRRVIEVWRHSPHPADFWMRNDAHFPKAQAAVSHDTPKRQRTIGNCQLFAEEVAPLVLLNVGADGYTRECPHMGTDAIADGRYEIGWIALCEPAGQVRPYAMCCRCHTSLRRAGVAPLSGTWERIAEQEKILTNPFP